ncbi:hypothetical protein CPCC7001_168 [Cyanobium sp. PCC 7001]|nr:hypothetical protein CPCC7001_168 [Cyanobium sp. PCC 7001]
MSSAVGRSGYGRGGWVAVRLAHGSSVAIRTGSPGEPPRLHPTQGS